LIEVHVELGGWADFITGAAFLFVARVLMGCLEIAKFWYENGGF
jgi:hypothetical protein